jgi:hypothetical protein
MITTMTGCDVVELEERAEQRAKGNMYENESCRIRADQEKLVELSGVLGSLTCTGTQSAVLEQVHAIAKLAFDEVAVIWDESESELEVRILSGLLDMSIFLPCERAGDILRLGSEND